MALVILIVVLALIEFTVISFQVGRARVKYGIKAPAITGNYKFECYFRVQQNTLEQLVLFIPAILSFAWMAESIGWAGNYIASGFGAIWLVGRFVYATSYLRDPGSRTVGFLMTIAPSVFMMIGTLICILISLV